jgi:hypothetical protein
MQRREFNTRLSRVPVNDGGILKVLAENKVRFKKLSVYRGKIVRLMPPHPLRSSQGAPRIRQVRRPIELQSSLSGLPLQHGIHGTTTRSRRNATGRNVRVSLQWQLNDMKPVPYEDGGSVLPDVAEGAEEVIPVQHSSQVILPALVAGSRSRSHVTNNFRVSTLIRPPSRRPIGTNGDGCRRSHCPAHERQPLSVRGVTMSRATDRTDSASQLSHASN